MSACDKVRTVNTAVVVDRQTVAAVGQTILVTISVEWSPWYCRAYCCLTDVAAVVDIVSCHPLYSDGCIGNKRH